MKDCLGTHASTHPYIHPCMYACPPPHHTYISHFSLLPSGRDWEMNSMYGIHRQIQIWHLFIVQDEVCKNCLILAIFNVQILLSQREVQLQDKHGGLHKYDFSSQVCQKEQEIQNKLKPTLFAFPNHKTDLRTLIVPTNAQFYYCVFQSSLVPTCFGLTAIIRELTAISLKLTL